MDWVKLLVAARKFAGRKRISIAIDMIAAAAALYLLVRGLVRVTNPAIIAEIMAAGLIVCLFALLVREAHRQVWHRVSLGDVIDLAGAAAIGAIGASIAMWALVNPIAASRVIIGGPFMLLCAWAGPRMFARLLWESGRRPVANSGTIEPVLVYGSGVRAEQFIDFCTHDTRYSVVGILQDDPELQGRRLRGVRMLGGLGDLPEILSALRRRGVAVERLIASEDEGGAGLSAALDASAQNELILCRLPKIDQAFATGNNGDVVRKVSIEDILHRDTVSIDDPRVAPAFSDRVVMVTGAGGSIGSELVRQIAAVRPRLLVLVENSEFNLYQIDHELESQFPDIERQTELCDIRNRKNLARIFSETKPEIVLHAAALKHVPLLENNPDQAIATNIFGTMNLAELARIHEVRWFTLVSTDKAVNPSNVMGATKRWAEIICQASDSESLRLGSGPRFTCVRFGNVLDSAGSVVPLFRRQIASGGPVTVTSEDVTRYFMTIPEACELILVATATMVPRSPKESQVYVLDMGEPVRVIDLATRMIQLHGLRPNVDVSIEVIGLRPGEKLYEELAHKEEDLVAADFPKARKAKSRTCKMDELRAALVRLELELARDDHQALRAELSLLVPEFEDPKGGAGPVQQPAGVA